MTTMITTVEKYKGYTIKVHSYSNNTSLEVYAFNEMGYIVAGAHLPSKMIWFCYEKRQQKRIKKLIEDVKYQINTLKETIRKNNELVKNAVGHDVITKIGL